MHALRAPVVNNSSHSGIAQYASLPAIKPKPRVGSAGSPLALVPVSPFHRVQNEPPFVDTARHALLA